MKAVGVVCSRMLSQISVGKTDDPSDNVIRLDMSVDGKTSEADDRWTLLGIVCPNQHEIFVGLIPNDLD